MFKTFQMELAGRQLVVETGKMAKQANGAALIRYGDTVVLVTSTGSKEAQRRKTRKFCDFERTPDRPPYSSAF